MTYFISFLSLKTFALSFLASRVLTNKLIEFLRNIPTFIERKIGKRQRGVKILLLLTYFL